LQTKAEKELLVSHSQSHLDDLEVFKKENLQYERGGTDSLGRKEHE
jgi:hypothetical protein